MKSTLAAISMLLLLIAILFDNLGHWLSEPINKPVKADLIVTLGGGGIERDQMAADLYKAGYAKKILLTGEGVVVNSSQRYYQSPRALFLLNQGIPAEALLFDGLSINTHQETLNIVTVLTAQHWHSALMVTDPPHIRRVGFCLNPLFKKAGLSYWLIQSDAPTWHANRWWQDDRWRGFSLLEVVKLIFYAIVYGT
jgi:uncharacterized SAM-binding protein YcdF (DUF218 family)